MHQLRPPDLLHPPSSAVSLTSAALVIIVVAVETLATLSREGRTTEWSRAESAENEHLACRAGRRGRTGRLLGLATMNRTERARACGRARSFFLRGPDKARERDVELATDHHVARSLLLVGLSAAMFRYFALPVEQGSLARDRGCLSASTADARRSERAVSSELGLATCNTAPAAAPVCTCTAVPAPPPIQALRSADRGEEVVADWRGGQRRVGPVRARGRDRNDQDGQG